MLLPLEQLAVRCNCSTLCGGDEITRYSAGLHRVLIVETGNRTRSRVRILQQVTVGSAVTSSVRGTSTDDVRGTIQRLQGQIKARLKYNSHLRGNASAMQVK